MRWHILAGASALLCLPRVASAQDLLQPIAATQAAGPPAAGAPPASAGAMPSFIVPHETSCTFPAPHCCPDREKPGPAPFTPFMLGDFSGPIANLFSEVKIAEGESPRPVDRVFYRTNYYNNLNKSRWRDPFEPIHNVDLWRNTFGMEKTFFNQAVSVGLRLPFNSLFADGKPIYLVANPDNGLIYPETADQGFDTTLLGNISAIFKAVVWEDRQNGDVLSAGITSVFPTASNKKIDPGISTITFLQPYTGFIFNRGDAFVQGFSSITLPIASAQSVVAFTDVGVGYWLIRQRDGMISGVAPTIEAHVATPLRQSDPNDTLGDGFRIFNVFNMTAGATVVFANGATLGVGAAVPFTGPKPFDIEALAQLNFRF